MKYRIMLMGSFHHDASYRFRVEAYMKDLQNDFDVEVKYLSERPNNIPNFLKRFYKIVLLLLTIIQSQKYDIIFMHRIVTSYKDSWLFERLLKKYNKNIIFDFDDAIYMHNNYKVSKIISLSSMVFAGNDFLKQYALNYSSRCFTIPTAIDTNKFQQRNNFNTNNITIGWTGTSSNYQFFSNQLIKQLNELLINYPNVNFLFICDKKPDPRFIFNYDFIKWNSTTEVEDLQKIDIGIMPLIDNEWTKGKCGFKLIQYGSIGIPSLGSDVGVNREIISDGQSGYIISNDIWYDKLEMLINDFKLRIDMGEFGRHIVENKYSIQKNYEIIKKLLISSVTNNV